MATLSTLLCYSSLSGDVCHDMLGLQLREPRVRIHSPPFPSDWPRRFVAPTVRDFKHEVELHMIAMAHTLSILEKTKDLSRSFKADVNLFLGYNRYCRLPE